MKIQYLAVIFVLIMMPIIIVFGEYINTQVTLVNTEALYDERLLNSTYDAIKAFQLNTINTTYYTPQTRVDNIDAAVNTFLNSLTTSFKYDGNTSDVMKEYIPAVVFTMYDGYYVYSPFENTLTGMDLEKVDKEYKKNGNKDGKILNGLKPYVSYSCKYRSPKNDGKEYVITYSLDNYIMVDVFEGSKHERHEGYLLNVEEISDKEYKYAGISFKEDTDKEKLSEIIPTKDGNGLERCFYTVKDGTKYYYSGSNTNAEQEPNDKDTIFYIANDGTRVTQVKEYKNNKERFSDYYNEIFANETGYQYYKKAYDFTKWVKENLTGLSTEDIVKNSPNYGNYDFAKIDNIFDGDNIEEIGSNFNRHRADVIRAVITTNLAPAITGFSKYAKPGEEFLMPKISETDWELLENNICIATFMQGMRIGGKAYNNYAVVPNNFNKEYVDENDIYILKDDNTYAKPNDTTLTNDTLKKKNDLGYYPGVLKINFERRMTPDGKYYNPTCYKDNGKEEPYLASYTSVSGTSQLNSLATIDMYKYMKPKTDEDFKNVRKAYFIALGRERYGSFKYTNNKI